LVSEDAMKPFYDHESGDWMVEARCVCGHFSRDHGSQVVVTADQYIRIPEHGSCCAPGVTCTCKQFTWCGWVSAAEYAQHTVKNRKRRLSRAS
jgi:hypothetical protein